MSDNLDLIKHYPWLPSLRIYRSDLASINPIEFIKNVNADSSKEILQDRIYEFFKSAFESIAGNIGSMILCT